MSSQQKKKRFDNVNSDLETLLSSYDALSVNEIEYIVPVYFPIAIVEMDTVERSFEDFDTIELIVLRLVEAGVNSAKAISNLLGLDERYVSRILKLLNGYDHISNGRITPLGRESIVKEKKIEKKAGRQQFQINALNKTVLRLEELVNERQIDDKDKTRIRVAHLMGIDGMGIEELVSQIKESDYQDFVPTGKEQSVNLLEITGIRFLEMKYAYSYMVKLFNCKPMIFCKRFDQSKKEVKERYKWVPLSVPSESLYSKLGISRKIPITTNQEIQQMNQTISLLNDERNRMDSSKKMDNYNEALEKTYPFDFNHCLPQGYSNGIIIKVDEKAFPEYTKSLYHILKYFGWFGKYLIVRDNFCGNILRLEPNDFYLLHVSEKLVKKIEEFGEYRVKSDIDDYFNDYPNEKDVIHSMEKVLNEIE